MEDREGSAGKPTAKGLAGHQPLIQNVLQAYREFLLHQGSAAFALVRWGRATRSLDFAWLGPVETEETLILRGEPLKVPRDSPLFETVKKMHTTVTLNPYEREVLYGFPFVIGRRDGKSIRAPLLTIPLSVVAAGDGFSLSGNDDALRFNALPFRVDGQETLDLALGRLARETPDWPADLQSIRDFLVVFEREFTEVKGIDLLDATLGPPPSEPTAGEFLRLEQQAAVFIAPRSNYFLASDLDTMAQAEALSESLVALLAGAGPEQAVEFSDDELDTAKLIFPFTSNRAQRKIALLLDDPTTSVVRVEGPPGTGKSLTIANLASHLAASGRSVLITSQRDKALSVVDEKLQGLGIRGFPMTLLRHDKDAKHELLERLADASRKERPSDEVREELQDVLDEVEELCIDYGSDRGLFDEAVAWEEDVFEAAMSAAGQGGIRGALARRRFRRAMHAADRASPELSDEIAMRAMRARADLLGVSARALQTSAELGVAAASRQERQQLKELEQLLRRNQKSSKNYHLFDRLKQDPRSRADAPASASGLDHGP